MQDPQDIPAPDGQARLFPITDSEKTLDARQLHDLEQAFRQWAMSSKRPDHRHSRERILLIFLIIRYTGARLNEVLSLDPTRDFDLDNHTIRFDKRHGGRDPGRQIQIPESVAADIRTLTVEGHKNKPDCAGFRIDPAHVRRKFYERATAVGIAPTLGSPETIRRSRAVELMQSNMPLPVIQKILGHSTPNLAASYVEFSDGEISRVARFFADRENRRKTSARNSFFGKITTIRLGNIQAVVEMISVNGNAITSAITRDSVMRLGLKPGLLVTAEVKAPSVQLCKAQSPPHCSADNLFQGTVCRITTTRTTAEVAVRLAGTELCAIITEKSRRQMDLRVGDALWVFFDAFTVVLHID